MVVLKRIRRESETDSTTMGSMAPVHDDRSLAALMTWVRNQFGGRDEVIPRDQAAVLRDQHAARTEPVTHAEIAELIDAAP